MSDNIISSSIIIPKIPLWIKIAAFGGISIIIALLVLIVYRQMEIANRQSAIETQMVAQKELIDGIVRSQNQYATKEDIEKFAKDNGINLQEIKDDLKKLHGNVVSVTTTTVVSKPQPGTPTPSSGTGPDNPTPPPPSPPGCPNCDPYGYIARTQTLQLNEDFGTIKVPIGTVGFSAWVKDKPWTAAIPSREYRLSTVSGMDENQRHYYYNKVNVRVDGKDYSLPIVSSETREIYPTAKFSWWNPRLQLYGDVGVGISTVPAKGAVTPGIGMSIMSYGRYKTTPDLTVLQLGIGYDTASQKAMFSIAPINFNLAGLFPGNIVRNTYLGPSLQVNTSGNLFVGGRLSVSF